MNGCRYCPHNFPDLAIGLGIFMLISWAFMVQAKLINPGTQNTNQDDRTKSLTFNTLQVHRSNDNGNSKSPVMSFTTDLTTSSSFLVLNFPSPYFF